MKTGVVIVIGAIFMVGASVWWGSSDDRLAEVIAQVAHLSLWGSAQVGAVSALEPVRKESLPTRSSVPAERSFTFAVNGYTSTQSTSAHIITYTSTGFIPNIVEVAAGESVQFVNASDRALRVVSANYPTAETGADLGLSAPYSIGRGESFSFTFTQPGVWNFKDLNHEQYTGTIMIQPQYRFNR